MMNNIKLAIIMKYFVWFKLHIVFRNAQYRHDRRMQTLPLILTRAFPARTIIILF